MRSARASCPEPGQVGPAALLPHTQPPIKFNYGLNRSHRRRIDGGRDQLSRHLDGDFSSLDAESNSIMG